MPRPSPSRPLVRVPVPPGAEGPARLLPALARALDGSGPAIAPIPVVSASVSNDYVMTLLAAVRADDDIPLESDEVAVVLATSGSTGAPRGVLLTADQLTALTPAVNGPGRRPQWIAALPVTAAGGLNVLLRSLAADREPVVVPSIGGAGPFTAQAFAQAVDQARRASDDVRVAVVPAQVARLLSDETGIAALQQCAAVLVGGAAARPSLIANARELGIAIMTTYGATETSGGCVFDGVPLPGVTVVGDGSPGVLRITSPSVALGYRGEPGLTARHFAGRTFVTSDLGDVRDDGTVTVLGRADDVVVVRGTNVSPAAVERAIADLPDIVSVATVVVEPTAGEPQLHAFVEVRDHAEDAEDAAAAEVVRRLGPAARPRIHRVDGLPHLPHGKVDRQLLRSWALGTEGTP